MDTGVVRMINQHRVAIETDEGYSVLAIEDGKVDIGDIIIGYLNDHGSETVANSTKKQTLSVYIDAIQVTRESAKSLLFYP